MADNKVLFGLNNVHFAFETDGGWEKPISIPGAVSLAANAEGNQNVFYADNVPYVTFNANSGYSGDLEMALIPDAVLAKALGWYIDANGALVEDAQAVARPFAMLYEVKGDQKGRRNVYYNCTISRPSSNASTTTDTTEPQTQTLSITMIPKSLTVDGVQRDVTKASMEKTDANAAIYNAFYDSVYIPSGETGETGATGATGTTGA